MFNGSMYRSVGVQSFGATAVNSSIPAGLMSNVSGTNRSRNITAGQGITSDLVGIPSGARHPIAWVMPQKAGALSSTNLAIGSSTVTLSMAAGRNIAATSTGAATGQATLQLVVSMVGTAAGIATVTGNILAALGMSGSSTGSGTATGTINALAWAYGVAEGTSTATLTRYATGRLYGAITPYTELSPQSLASAVLDAASTAPIAANIKKVNDYSVTGDGNTTPWGPV